DGSFSYNNFYVDAPLVGSFPEQSLAVWTWEGVNITVESEGPDQRGDSIQKRVIGRFADNYDVVFNDDGSGEAADVIALRQLDNGTVLLHLIHCKYSASPDPGARVEDLYELCGQAQKSARWKHRGLHDLVLHMKHREAKWRDAGNSRFRKGDASVLSRLLKVSQYSSLAFEATVVQPGLSKRLVSQDMRSLLGSTDLYLKKTADATLHVVCSI
ncbi:MAG: type III restriction endonuclease subunit R, partial [Candidatus Brocadiia bacterium]